MTNSQISPAVELFGDWLTQQGLNRDTENAALKTVLAWQLHQAMQQDNLSKSEMARRMDTSRPQLERLLDPTNGNITLDTLIKAAAAVGRKLSLTLV